MKRVYLEAVRPLTYDQSVEKRRHVEFEKTKFYVNRLPSEVYIRDRSGLLTSIRPRVESRAFEPDYFFVCEQLQCSPKLKEEYIQQARKTSETMRHYAHKVVLYNWSGEPPVSSKYSVEAQCALSLNVILKNDGVLYLEEHDVVVMYGLSETEMEKIHHPYTIAGYANKSFQRISEQNPNLRKGDFTFNIRIVDNHDQFGSRWILIGDEAFAIVACKDDQVTDGIYVTYSKNMLGGKGAQKLFTDRFEFGDGANLPYYKLYETQQDAMIARRSLQVEEVQARMLELESKATTAENNWLKTKQERENLEREAQLKASVHEQAMDKLRRENEKLQKEQELYLQKHVGEMLSFSRKNTAEVIKCVPVILSGIAYAVAVLSKRS